MVSEGARRYIETLLESAQDGSYAQRWLKEINEALSEEPFMNKPCVSKKVCRENVDQVLQSLISKINEQFEGYDICEYYEDYDMEENDISEYRSVGSVSDIIQMIEDCRQRERWQKMNVNAMCNVMEESLKREKMDMFFELVSEGSLSPEVAISKLNIENVDELFSEMEKAGYKISELNHRRSEQVMSESDVLGSCKEMNQLYPTVFKELAK